MTTFLKITDETRANPGPGVILSIVEDGTPLAWISLQRPAIGALIWLLARRYVHVALIAFVSRIGRGLEAFRLT